MAPRVFLKVAPDLAAGDHDRIVRAALDAGIDALIVATPPSRDLRLNQRRRAEPGGCPARPQNFGARCPANVPQLERRRASADCSRRDPHRRRCLAADPRRACLVQLYSALVYHGPALRGASRTSWPRSSRAKTCPTLASGRYRTAVRHRQHTPSRRGSKPPSIRQFRQARREHPNLTLSRFGRSPGRVTRPGSRRKFGDLATIAFAAATKLGSAIAACTASPIHCRDQRLGHNGRMAFPPAEPIALQSGRQHPSG